MTELLFKVIIIGDATVGKTSFVKRYVNNHPGRDYKPTVGVDFALKVIKYSDDTTIRLQLWDIAGQERFSTMTRVYYKGAAACVIMFDLTSQQTFNSTIKWKRDLDSKCTLPDGKTIPCILVGNKSDLSSTRPIEKEAIDKLCRENGFLGWTEMSVKEDVNVSETMEYLLTELLDCYKDNEEKVAPKNTSTDQGGFIELTSHKTAKENTSRSGCCS
ncbi:ras-related protein Rab-7L1-like [Stylophora pistillata]|uniref:Ras-related protein Rab n=1 Tax=Stylophora pistillata TaxID=50429 RepID=A0A2B4SHI3_STYPI|nr:ras-related protein Rab-7L1-like [Stylophora pistillata]PFX29331.1 Ras-related protein Rab-7L1 [Stylophora pistillata]